MAFEAVLIRNAGRQLGMEKGFFRKILTGHGKLYNVTVGTASTTPPDLPCPAIPGFPEMTATTHLAVVVDGHTLTGWAGNELPHFRDAIFRVMGPSGLKGLQNPSIRGHDALLHPVWQRVVTPISTAGEPGKMKAPWVGDEPQVGSILLSGKRITQVAGGTSHDVNGMRRRRILLGLMTQGTVVDWTIARLLSEAFFYEYEEENPCKDHQGDNGVSPH